MLPFALRRLAAAAVMLAAPCAFAAPLQFVNGDFSNGLSGWNVWSGNPTVSNGSLTFNSPGIVQQLFPANGDRTIYEVSFRVKSDPLDPAVTRAWAMFLWHGSFFNIASTAAGQDWTTYSVYWTPAGFDTAVFSISFNNSDSSGPSPFHFDDFRMTPVSQTPGVPDGGSTGLMLCAGVLSLLVHRRGRWRPGLNFGDTK
jgi:hypothetical protein